MTNKVIRDKSRCSNCMNDKSKFLKQNHDLKSSWIILILDFSNTSHYKTC